MELNFLLITVNRQKPKNLTVSRQNRQNLTINRQSYTPIETLFKESVFDISMIPHNETFYANESQ